MNEDKIISEVKTTLRNTIQELILDPAFEFKIENIDIEKKYPEAKNDYSKIVTIYISTNNRPLLLGQFLEFPINGLRGFHPNYFYGLLEGRLTTKYENEAEDYCFHINVEEKEGCTSSRPYKFLGIDDALNHDIVDRESPLHQFMREYELEYILIAGGAVSSPVVGMMDIVETTCREHNPKTVLDLFSGSGSLAKIALKNGANYVKCIDQNTEVIDSTIKDCNAEYEIIETDIFNFSLGKIYDLVLVDPFYAQSLDVSKEIIPQLLEKAKIVIFNISKRKDPVWANKVERELNELNGSFGFLEERGTIIAKYENKVFS